MQRHRNHTQENHSCSISIPPASIPPNDNPPILSLPITFLLHPRIPLHHSLHALNRDLITRPIDTRDITISALTYSMLTRLSILMLPRTDRANFSTRAVDGEMRPGHQIAVGGFASRAAGGCLVPVSVGCGAAELGWMVGCGVCVQVVCDGCGRAGRRWVGDLGFWFGRGVSLGGFGWRHGWIVPGGVQWGGGRSACVIVLSSCSCSEASCVSEVCR